MDYKEALFQVIKACQEEEDTEDEPALTKKIIEILGQLDDQEYATKIVSAMVKSEMPDDSGAAISCIDFLEKKALEGLRVAKEARVGQGATSET